MNVEIEYQGIRFSLEGEYTKAEREEGISPSFELEKVYVVGGGKIDIFNILSIPQVLEFEELALKEVNNG